MAKASLEQYKRRIETTLEKFFLAELKKNIGTHPLSTRMLQAIREFTMRKGAKRTRGMLVLLGYQAKGRRHIPLDMLKVAAAYELLQSYLLIHDDIIDNDDVRRNKPTLHKIFATYVVDPSSQTRDSVGKHLAIIAGDVASELVQRIIMSTSYPTSQQIALISHINKTLYTTYIGQVLDILARPTQIPLFKDQLYRYEQKTAQYTIGSPFLAGVLMSGKKIDEKIFASFTKHVGIAFQLADDIQNLYGNAVIGRQSDIREGKITLLVSYALKSARYKKKLLGLLKKKHKSVTDIKKLKDIILHSGAYDAACAFVQTHIAEARKITQKLGLSSDTISYIDMLLQKIGKSVKNS